MLDIAVSNLTSALVSAAAAGVLAMVGRDFWTREVAPESFHASRSFGAWWTGAAGYLLLDGALPNAAAGFGVLDLRLFRTFSQLETLVLCLALLGLTYHAAYLLTGRRRLVVPVGVLWFALYAIVTFIHSARTVVGVDVGAWDATLRYLHPPSSGESVLVLGLLCAPALLAALAYAAVAARVATGGSRRRAFVLSGLLLAWVGGAFANQFLAHEALAFATAPLLELATAVLVMATYRQGAGTKPRIEAPERAERSFS